MPPKSPPRALLDRVLRWWHPDPDPAIMGQVTPFDLFLADPAGQAAAVINAGGWWSGQKRTDASRMIAVSRPYRPQRILDYLEEVRRGCGPREEWRYNSLVELHHGMGRLLASSDLREIDYYLLCWPGNRGNGRTLLHSAAAHFGTTVTEVQMPAVFGDFQDWGGYLAPLDGGGPFLALYSVWGFVGGWRPDTIHKVLHMPFPLAMAIDIENLGSKGKTELETAYNTLSSQLRAQAKMGNIDPHAQAALVDVIRAQTALEDDQTLHEGRIVLLIQAPTLELLAEYGAQLEAELNTVLKLRHEPGQGVELLKYFSPIHRRQIGSPLTPLPLLSAGCGVLAGQYGYATHHETRGLPLGIDGRTRNPNMYDLWGKAEERGANAVFLGKTGSGKTFTMETLFYRLATILNTQVFILDKLGNFVGLPLALGDGAYYCKIALGDSSLNLLDIVYPDPDSCTRQVQHVIDQLSLLLGVTDKHSASSRRRLTDQQREGLELVLLALYEPIWQEPGAPPPLLSNVCDRLESLGKQLPRAARLGRVLRGRFVRSSLGSVFDRPSTVPTHFPHQVYIFDISELDECYAPVIYMQLITLLKRFAFSPARRRPVVVGIDEFKVAAQDPVIAQAAVDLTKVGRNLQLGVWTADQDPSSYSLTPQAKQMLANLALVCIGRQEGEDVEDVMKIFHRLTVAHKRRMLRAQTGQFITRTEDNYRFTNFEPTGRELFYFGGKRAERRRRLLEYTRQQAAARQARAG